jgi:hypothetical protein
LSLGCVLAATCFTLQQGHSQGTTDRMKHPIRKLIGTIIFVIGSGCYFLFVISIAIVRLPDTPMSTQLLFYFVTTLIWLILAGLLILWMERRGSPS